MESGRFIWFNNLAFNLGNNYFMRPTIMHLNLQQIQEAYRLDCGKFAYILFYHRFVSLCTWPLPLEIQAFEKNHFLCAWQANSDGRGQQSVNVVLLNCRDLLLKVTKHGQWVNSCREVCLLHTTLHRTSVYCLVETSNNMTSLSRNFLQCHTSTLATQYCTQLQLRQ